jgi:membrane-bound lytic murein transglycosylase F
MINRFNLVVLLIGFWIAGCTPLGEDVLRNGSATRGEGGQQRAEMKAPGGFDQPEPIIDPDIQRVVRLYGPTIRESARRYGLDWRLVLATMKQESQFRADAESHRGAVGLMQLMPHTGAEVAEKIGVASIAHPEDNIRAGVYYLHRLHEMFEGANDADRIRLTLAAYNAGIGRIYDAQDVAAHLHENPMSWNAVRDALPLLSRRHEEFHRDVWNAARPRSGYLNNSRQTIAYVEHVLAHYEEYQLVLN